MLRWARRAVVGSFGVLVAIWVARPFVIGDTPFVLDGTNAFLGCLSRGDLTACDFSGKLDYWGLMSPIGDWPLLQYLPDVVTVELVGDSHQIRTRVLELLGVGAMCASLVLAWIVLSRVGQRSWFWGFALVLLSGPLLWYAGTTAGEALATGLLVGVVAAAALRVSPPLLALAVFAACLTKETSYPFVAALGILGLLLARRRTSLPVRAHLVWGAAGVLAAFVFSSLFDVVRFGSVLDTNYLQPQLHTPGVARPLEYTVALFVSPNGGMIPFWPAASALLLAACVLPLGVRSGARLDPVPAVVLVGVIIGLTLGMAAWWDPFGTFYGPRLTLPWVLPLVLLALVAYGDVLGDLVGRLLASWWRLVAVFVVVFVFTLPHVGKLWRPDGTNAFFQNRKPPCDAPWRGGVARFHECQSARIWWVHLPLPAYALEGVATLGGALTGFAVGLGLFGCLVLLRDNLPSRGAAATARTASPAPSP